MDAITSVLFRNLCVFNVWVPCCRVCVEMVALLSFTFPTCSVIFYKYSCHWKSVCFISSADLTLFNGESWELLIRRWAKLEKDFRLKNGRFDISKIPDIYDCIKYDLHYNQKTLQFKRSQELFMCSKALADIIIPQVGRINWYLNKILSCMNINEKHLHNQ